ncbi:MAG: hypothetical protein PVJ68_14995 [Candidatus Thiodiazotropha sp.]|jgi:hypothetical protein
MNRRIEEQIDQLILEKGEYHPLELLLQEERLSYEDYEAWRSGEIRDLADLLFGNPEQILKSLEQAADYLQRLGWESERLIYRERGRPDAGPLRFSQESRFDDSFHRAYRKPREQPQLDLFSDTTATYLVNGITQALKTLNATDARQSLQRLCESAPDHSQLGELERLVEALESLDSPLSDVEAEQQRLQTETSPLAERHLNKASGFLLIPLWRRLTGALQHRVFDPSRPDLHPSYTAIQARDWTMVRQAVEQEVDWQRQPLLLERHAMACTYLSDQAAALQSWCLICWQFPEMEERLERCGDHTLQRGWQAFLDLEPELPTEDFPAWLILKHPGLAQIAPHGDADIPCPDSYRTLYHLVHDREHLADDQMMNLRAKLKQQAPLIFRHYLKSV